jgi:hypothetical protein
MTLVPPAPATLGGDRRLLRRALDLLQTGERNHLTARMSTGQGPNHGRGSAPQSKLAIVVDVVLVAAPATITLRWMMWCSMPAVIVQSSDRRDVQEGRCRGHRRVAQHDHRVLREPGFRVELSRRVDERMAVIKLRRLHQTTRTWTGFSRWPTRR